MLEVKDIKLMDDKAMLAKVEALKTELFQMKMQAATSANLKPHTKKVMKKEIARILTVRNAQKKEKK